MWLSARDAGAADGEMVCSIFELPATRFPPTSAAPAENRLQLQSMLGNTWEESNMAHIGGNDMKNISYEALMM